MACNCGKNSKPTGYGSTPSRAKQAAQDAAQQAASAGTQQSTGSNSGTTSTTGGTQSFALTSNGRTQTFGSKLERDAAAIRAGIR
jgi:hypothetical protein